jgi:hypothetical protein
MSAFLSSLVLFACLYAPLRLLNENWKKYSLPPWCVWIAGILSWGVLLSLAGPAYAMYKLFAAVLKAPNLEAGFEIGAVFILFSIIAKTLVDRPDILNFDQTKPFIRHSLCFRNYHAEHHDLFEALEKKNINDIHKEMTGHDIRESPRTVKVLPHIDPEHAKRELARYRAQPLKSVHIQSELAELRNEQVVDITDTFRINVLKHPTHRLYEHVYELRIDPSVQVLSFKVNLTRLTGDIELDPEKMFHVKQDLYDLLQALNTEEWLKSYASFFEKIQLTSFRVQLDSFDLPQHFPFMSIEIPVRELLMRIGRIYSVADLHTIAVVTMHSQQPRP